MNYVVTRFLVGPTYCAVVKPMMLKIDWNRFRFFWCSSDKVKPKNIRDTHDRSFQTGSYNLNDRQGWWRVTGDWIDFVSLNNTTSNFLLVTKNFRLHQCWWRMLDINITVAWLVNKVDILGWKTVTKTYVDRNQARREARFLFEEHSSHQKMEYCLKINLSSWRLSTCSILGL